MHDAPMMGYGQNPLIQELMDEVANQAAEMDGQLTDVSAKILDEAADLSEDELDATVPGVDGSLGQRIFNVGKFQKAGQLMTFKVAYEQDKKYVAWVRKFIKGKNTDPTKANRPTMTQTVTFGDGGTPKGEGSGGGSTTAAQGEGHGDTTTGADDLRCNECCIVGANAHPASASSQSSGAWEDQWVVANEPEAETVTETLQERRRRAIREQIELLTYQLEEMQEAEDL
ncbi:hypothetical protein AK812_SmicGene23863 [Symbiodinium microadriaticum]|uniref:Uncharacterized protein n=1 Tax=Symbiodinium microadriaticum TaxID=2951 RepID=A0A1Q9DG17_SYMMI|nr:hypothetical protein AK812_SmicGene23863 [Symbiodinium microadriaticum]